MSCASCPYLVEQAVTAVEGVKSVKATMEDRSAAVTYDDAMTTVDVIRGATAAIGYDSTVVETGSGS
jgi:mercuric ion binding protein